MSLDSLKKKICVTVFLDELFEEVNDEKRGDFKQVSDVYKAEVNITDEISKVSTRFDSDTYEKNKISSNGSIDSKQTEIQPRPRKRRKESKFSKNSYEPLKHELERYQYGNSDAKAQCCGRELIESTFSDSELDSVEYHEYEKCLPQKSKSFLSEFSEVEVTEKSFLSLNPTFSSSVNNCDKEKSVNEFEKNVNKKIQFTKVSYSHKSTQFDGIKEAVKKIDEKIQSDVSPEQQHQNEVDDALAWKITQEQIQFILAKAKCEYEDKKAWKEDRSKQYNLRSILEECERIEGKNTVGDPSIVLGEVCTTTHFYDSDVLELSDSYTCVFPHVKRKIKNHAPELKRVWTNVQKNTWNDGFESDLSEPDSISYPKNDSSNPLRNDSRLCYRMCIHCKENVFDNSIVSAMTDLYEDDCNNQWSQISEKSSLDSLQSKKSLEIKQIIDVKLPEAKDRLDSVKNFNVEDDKSKSTKGVGQRGAEGRNKNYAEGDTFEKPVEDSNLIFDLESKEKLLECDEILKGVGENNSIPNEIIVNRAEVEFVFQNKKKSENCQISKDSKVKIAEVFSKKNTNGHVDKNVTDEESELIFAESEVLCSSEDVLSCDSKHEKLPSYTFPPHPFNKDMCIMELEDKLSHSKLLRRMKTVEILEDSSISEIKNISTEVILICENISRKDVCLEAWQSVSPFKSFEEIGQCYLKDSKESSMYLIEIPLHFTHTPNLPASDTDPLFKNSDSD